MNDFAVTVINIIFWVGLHFASGLLITSLPHNFKAKIFGSRFFSVSDAEMRFYRKIRLNYWKDKLPQYNDRFDKRHLKQNPDLNYIETYITETKIAETVHYTIGVLGYFSVLFMFFSENRSFWAVVYILIATLILALNLPFALIQRYNRFRLEKVYDKMKRRQ